MTVKFIKWPWKASVSLAVTMKGPLDLRDSSPSGVFEQKSRKEVGRVTKETARLLFPRHGYKKKQLGPQST